MNSFGAVLKNDLERMLTHKTRILFLFILIICAVTAAVFFNTQADTAGNIAFVSQSGDRSLSSPYLNVTHLNDVPPMSELVSGKYDAVVTEVNGQYDIQTIKSDDFKQTLTNILLNPTEYHPDQTGQRKAGTNIVGFLTMFIMMQGMTLMILFAEDKERGQINRVASSPVSFTGYFCAHSSFAFFFLLIPTMLILYVIKFVMGISIGFGFLEYLLLLSLLCALSTAFALFLNTLVSNSDSANMAGSAIVILTSVLAGSFYSFDKGNRILEALIKVLPQKSFLTLASGLESGSGIQAMLPHLIYLLGLTVVFFLIAVIKTRKDYIRQ